MFTNQSRHYWPHTRKKKIPKQSFAVWLAKKSLTQKNITGLARHTVHENSSAFSVSNARRLNMISMVKAGSSFHERKS